jgi:PAS domain S-box-containing protein
LGDFGSDREASGTSGKTRKPRGTSDSAIVRSPGRTIDQNLLEASNDAIYILSGSQFLYANQRFSELFGWSSAELLADTFDYRRLIHVESQPLVEARAQRAGENQPLPSRYEFRAVRSDGSAFDVEVSVSYIQYNGKPAVLGILQDVTARKAYEKTLLRKNHELSVLNAVAEAITQVRDLSAILDGVVERLLELLQVDAAGIALVDDAGERITSIHFRGVSETFIREARHKQTNFPMLRIALSTKEPQIIPELAKDSRLADGGGSKEGFTSAVALPLSSHERTFGVIAVYTREKREFAAEDIDLFTAVARQIAVAIENARLYKKAREGIARLQALSEIARAIGSTLDVEGVFRIVGDRLQTLVPFRRVALFIVRRDGNHFSVRTIDRPAPGESPVVRLYEPMPVVPGSPFAKALESHETAVLEADQMPGGHPATIETLGRSAVVPIVADHTAMGVFVVTGLEAMVFRERDLDLLRDLAAHMAISLKNARVFQDLERAYRELKDAKDRLVRSEKLQGLGEMAAGVAHDFNNVLSAILGRAQMLKVMLQNEEMLKSVRVIEKAALDGAGTVRRIQEFAKEKSDSELVVLQVNPLVRDAVEMTTHRVNEMGIGIDVQVELGETGAILGNPTELREVLTNLIHNAIDAMHSGGCLSVRTGRTTIGDQAWFEVEDTGIGMDDETLKKIFDPFFTTKGTRGTGLGMSVSYGIVQRHGGEFSISSRRGAGSRVRVLIPMADESGFGTAANLTPVPNLLSEATLDTPRGRILVVDDDTAVRDLLVDMLKTGGHEVTAAASGEDGIVCLAAAEFDLVFTDLGMPGISGWEVAKEVKISKPNTIVGLITGWGASLDENRLAEQGIDLIVAKPFRFQQVLAMVADALRARERS